MNMKKGSLILRLLAAALVACLIISAFAACGSAKTLMSVTKDGKTYTISTDEFSLLMKIKKLDICCSMLVTRSRDTASYWATTTDDGETYEEYYKNLILEQTKSILVEKYLFDVNGLSISSDKLAGYKSNIKTQNTYYGGKGAYKQYFGYTAADYYNIYMMMVARSEAVVDFLFGENGSQKLTAEDLETYYKENYVGYQFIMLDMENKVKLDEEGNRIIAKEEDSEGNEVDSDSYETEALTDEEKETKQTLVQAILDELAEGASFEDMIAKYSDAYYSVEFPEGMFVLKDGTFLSTTITEKIKDLEIGEYTEEAIESNKCQYIVKRVELKDKVYEDEKYLELFEEYEDTVKYDKYENYIETFFDDITVDEAVAAEYTVADTYLSKYADLYYQQWWSSYLSSSS
jgi:PPIC-type PPIASE domain protein